MYLPSTGSLGQPGRCSRGRGRLAQEGRGKRGEAGATGAEGAVGPVVWGGRGRGQSWGLGERVD